MFHSRHISCERGPGCDALRRGGFLLPAVLFSLRCCLAAEAGPGFLTDVSELFRGLEIDMEMVASVVFAEDGDTILLTRNDQYGLGVGYAYEINLRRRERRLVVRVNAQMEGAPMYRFPELVAKVDDFRYIMNLEGVEVGLMKYGTSRNVFLYDTRRRERPDRGWRALTQFTANSGKGARALRYFAEEGVILVEVGKLSDSDVAMIVNGTEVPFCLTLDSLRLKPVEKYPRIAEWYRRYRAAQSVISYSWRQNGVGGVYTFRKPGMPETRSIQFAVLNAEVLTRAFHLAGDFYVIGNVMMGTHIFDLEGLADIKLAAYVPLGVDGERMRILLRSRRYDERIKYRYWLFDVRAYFQTLQRRLYAATRQVPEDVK